MSAPNSTWRRSALWFALALVVQLAIIGGMVFGQQSTTEHGKAVYFGVEPVDPRDPLRGDYLTFQYTNVSRVPVEYFDSITGEVTRTSGEMARELQIGETVWVPLSPVGQLWQAQPGAVAGATKPNVGPDSPYGTNAVLIRGSVESTSSTEIRIVYGIEEYFVPEGKASTWPMAGRPDAKARVLVDPKTGKAQLNQVFLDGKPWP